MLKKRIWLTIYMQSLRERIFVKDVIILYKTIYIKYLDCKLAFLKWFYGVK